MPIHATRLPAQREPAQPAQPWSPPATRYLATRLHGDGTETIVADELPLADVDVQVAVSGTGGLSGMLSPEVARLKGDVLVPGRTAIYAATAHGLILGGGILSPDSAMTGPTWSIQCTGHAGWLDGQPYRLDRKSLPGEGIDVDPADLIRHAWAHVQSRPHHDLGVVVDDLTTDVRVGTEPEDVEFETGEGEHVAFEAGPIDWAEHQTPDLAAEVKKLCESTPIDYLMTHTLTASTVTHRLRLGHPRIGTRRHDLSFVEGVNIRSRLSVGFAPDVAEVLMLGAGEGSARKRGSAARNPGGLGRTQVIEDKSLTSDAACADAAQRHLNYLTGGHEIESVTISDHPNAPTGSWQVGDDILIQGAGQGWAPEVDLWVRILSASFDLDAGTAVCSVTAAGRL